MPLHTHTGAGRRDVLHADLDTFFVSVERLIDPRLAGRPVIVGGLPGGRGVVAACSYEARACGVTSGMALRLAARRCREAVFLPANPDAYRLYSRRVAALLQDAAPVVEQASVDEFYLDLSGCEGIFGNLFQWSERLKAEVNGALRLPISMGLAANKLVAKMATGTVKGGTQGKGRVASVVHGLEAAFLAPFSVERLPGVGPKTSETLRRLGLFRLGSVQQVPEATLAAALGVRGLTLARYARGLDDRPVRPHREAQSAGHERTFSEDTLDPETIFRTMRRLAEKTAFDLRRADRCATRLVFKLRYADFKTHTRARRFPATNDGLVLFEQARGAFRALFTRRVRIRLVGLRAEGLVPLVRQGDLYDDTWERRQRLLETLDTLRDRYGYDVIRPASMLAPAD